jgi:hypothetical protein
LILGECGSQLISVLVPTERMFTFTHRSFDYK